MKNYKRLTERRSGAVIDNCGNCPNVNNKQGCTDKKCYEIMKNRLAELEDKIASGELCDREEVEQEAVLGKLKVKEYRVSIPIERTYNGEEVEQIVKDRDIYKRALQIAEELGELCAPASYYIEQARKEKGT